MTPQDALRGIFFSTATLGMLAAPFSASATTVMFGTGASQFTMDFVDVGNPGNADDVTGYGGVSYAYQMGTYEVSRDMITKANAPVGDGGGNLGITLADMTAFGGNGADRPATGISWNEAARFVNWLNTSQGFHAAYNFNTGGANDNIALWSSTEAWQLDGENLFRHKDAHYFLPSEDEWYKTAYYDGSASTYFDYATGSDTAPTSVTSGTAAGTAVYGQGLFAGPANVTIAGGLSPYGTMAQNGNVFEWTESALTPPNDSSGENRVFRGGVWSNASSTLQSSSSSDSAPTFEASSGGFRVAAIPEPTSSLMTLLGVVGLMLRRRR
ncbi:MAG: SUMF1/EgtB/PvdO family nonheme iron enzyme [Verrucomicrobiales bacterium]